MKNYLDEIYTISRFKLDNPKLSNKAEIAKNYLKNFNHIVDEEKLVVIEVEGYYCIACILDDFAPYELDETIQPFDEDNIYPIQGLETKYRFKRYY